MNKIVDTARGYLGTPFKHQGRLKGVGVDCIGLVMCVARDMGISHYENTKYGRIPQRDMLLKEAKKHMTLIDKSDLQPGDVLLFQFIPNTPQHFAIYAGDSYIIHSYEQFEKVIEHRMDGAWERRIVACFRLKGV